jgi:hypothetical protein
MKKTLQEQECWTEPKNECIVEEKEECWTEEVESCSNHPECSNHLVEKCSTISKVLQIFKNFSLKWDEDDFPKRNIIATCRL